MLRALPHMTKANERRSKDRRFVDFSLFLPPEFRCSLQVFFILSGWASGVAANQKRGFGTNCNGLSVQPLSSQWRWEWSVATALESVLCRDLPGRPPLGAFLSVDILYQSRICVQVAHIRSRATRAHLGTERSRCLLAVITQYFVPPHLESSNRCATLLQTNKLVL